ncbi:MAG: AAA family ATPase [Myxococcota bacterium]
MDASSQPPVRIANPRGPLPRGMDDFAKAITRGCCLVDKTPLVDRILNGDDEVTLITRPRRFGKTTNMSMLRYFFETPPAGTNTRALFDGLLVEEDAATMAHQGKYPVISLTLKSAKLPTWEEAYGELCSLIRAELERHIVTRGVDFSCLPPSEREVYQRTLAGQGTQKDWRHSLELLCKLLTLHHNKDNPNQLSWTHPVVLVDEYDAPIHAAYTHSIKRGEDPNDDESHYGRMIDFIRLLLGNALKGNKYLHKAVLTGILRVAKEDIFSGLSNPGVYGVLEDRFAASFGFTEPEARELLTRRGLADRLDAVRAWYDGYCIGADNPVTIYNPWSVVSYLANPTKVPRLYWVNTSDNALVHTLLRCSDADMKNELLQVLFGSSKHIARPILDEAPLRSLTGAARELWSLLLASGYATADKTERDIKEGGPNIASLRVPNVEVKCLYKDLIESWFAQEPRKEKTTGMVKALLAGNGELFAQRLQAFVHASMSYFNTGGDDPERVYQAFVLGLLVQLEQDYRLRSEREAGEGRADVSLIPKQPNKPGIILEFKLAENVLGQRDQAVVEQGLQQTAQAALRQIKDKHYAAAFVDCQCSFVLAVGVAFAGKSLTVAHERLGE